MKLNFIHKLYLGMLNIVFILSSIIYYPTKIVAQTQQPATSQKPVQPNQSDTSSQKSTSRPVFVLPKTPPGLSSISGRRAGMGSRGNCPAVVSPLTALVPSQVVGGLTTSERPTFWFYIPYTQELANSDLQFSLQDLSGNDVYRNALTLPAKPSVMGITLPPTVTPLQVGQTYRWYLKVRCNQQQAESVPIYVEGNIQRVNLDSSVMQQLETANNQQKIAIYDQKGIWFDSLNVLAQQRLVDPSNASLAADWQSLLHSVQLDNVAAAPLVIFTTNSQQVYKVPN